MEKKLKKSYIPSNDQPKFQWKSFDKLLLKNGSIVDIENKKTIQQDILIVNGKIESIDNISPERFDGEIIDITDKLIAPGFLDIHVHFREPGREDEETLMTGAAAAIAGGFTGVCTMPNTEPVTDDRETVEFITDKFKNHLVDIYPIAAITKGREGKQLVEMADLVEAGVVAFSDDGTSVTNSQLLRRALEYSRMFNIPIIEHCEDPYLTAGGTMNEGFMSTRLGLPGIPSISEEVVIARDIMLAKYTSGKIHIAHVSTAGSVELIRRAKAEGIKITCEVTPHHFTLTDKALEDYDTNLKMNPPLRTSKDVAAIIDGLKDGTIDAIVTDHAPHSIEEKETEFIAAPFGIIGLETAIGLVISELVGKHNFSVYEILEKLSVNPYRILGLPAPLIAKDAKPNLTILDMSQEWIVDKTKFKSRSRNTPFHGWKLKGKSWAVFNNNMLKINSEP